MKKMIAALALSVLCTGWGWGSSVPSCGDERTDEQMLALMFDTIGVSSDDEGKTMKFSMGGQKVTTGKPITLERFFELSPIEFALHRETKFENNIWHCEFDVKVDVSQALTHSDEYFNLSALALTNFAGTLTFTIQVTEDGTPLWTVDE